MSQARGAPNLHDSILRMPFGHNTLTHRHAPRRFGTPRIARADRHPPMPTPPETRSSHPVPRVHQPHDQPLPTAGVRPITPRERSRSSSPGYSVVCPEDIQCPCQAGPRMQNRGNRAQEAARTGTGALSMFQCGNTGRNRGTDRGRGYSVTPSGNESPALGGWPQNVGGRSLVQAADGGGKSRPLPLTQPSPPGGGEGEGGAALPRAFYLRHGLWR
jgi:hypothetical protein